MIKICLFNDACIKLESFCYLFFVFVRSMHYFFMSLPLPCTFSCFGVESRWHRIVFVFLVFIIVTGNRPRPRTRVSCRTDLVRFLWWEKVPSKWLVSDFPPPLGKEFVPYLFFCLCFLFGSVVKFMEVFFTSCRFWLSWPHCRLGLTRFFFLKREQSGGKKKI